MSSRIAVLASQRIPFARSLGQYMGLTNQDLMTTAVAGLVDLAQLKRQTLGEVVLGSVIKHSSDWNFTREVILGSGLSPHTPGYDIVQACGSSLEACIAIGNKITLGQVDVGIAGGSDTNSDLPFVFSRRFNNVMLAASKEKSMLGKVKQFMKLGPSDLKPQMPAVVEPRTDLSMGQSCELMAKEWKIPREEQDQLALISHQNAAAAWKAGFYNDLVTPLAGLKIDNNVRADTTMEKLAKLKPAFDKQNGTLTAGNSSALTDGAACVLLASEQWAKERGMEPLAYITHMETAAVDFVNGEGLLMAPTYAVAKMLKKANLKLQDFDIYEIHEAFAAQVLCTLKAWESGPFCREKLGLSTPLGPIDRTKMNLKGGSIALGHPFAATGARIVGGLAKMLKERGSGRGLVSICTGGGMGVTAILERP
jgi:acetyl-CoA C-acetyltransferase